MNNNTNKKHDDSSSSEYSDMSEDEKERVRKLIPAHIRLREAIKQQREERKKGTKKYKENFDE